jgi:putative flippase GtrA
VIKGTPNFLDKILSNVNLNEVVRFFIVGLIATGLHYGIYLILMRYIAVNLAYSTGYLISFLANYFLSAHFTFESKVSIKKGIGFGISHLINYSLHLLFLNVFLSFQISKSIAPIPVFLLVIPINFFLVRFIFKSKKFQS